MGLNLVNRIIGAPPTVIIHRNDPVHEPVGYPYHTAAVIPDVPVEMAPNPFPASTLFAGYGRDAMHAPTPLRVWEGGLAMSEWLSVMGWPFGNIVHGMQSALIAMPRGQQNPIGERSIIDAPSPTSLGAMTTLSLNSSAPATLHSDLAKIAL